MAGMYSLIDCQIEERMIIKPDHLMTTTDMNSKAGGTVAESWLDAKQRLGFPLSAVQEYCFDKQGIPLWRVTK